jgi:glycosyltransferase involved in cell wall biosynthesis
VARRLGRTLQEIGQDPIFVVWEENPGRYVLPTDAEHEILSRFNGPQITNSARFSQSPGSRTTLTSILDARPGVEPWLLLSEVLMESVFRPIRRFAQERAIKLAAIFYDSIPVLRPDLCSPQISNNHGLYMLGLAECNLALPISYFSARCLEDFWREAGVTTMCRVVADVLAGEFGGSRRSTARPVTPSMPVKILCVSTLEPRKNHRKLIEACLWISESYPDLDWSLTLVGNRYFGAFELADWIEEVAKRNSRIKWLGVVDDATLNQLYQECSFTVYPSLLEGFGLPIVESMWHGRPCICFNQGVMAELAEEGGCYTVDVTDAIGLGAAIRELSTNEELRTRLTEEAAARPLKTWKDYAFELCVAVAKEPVRGSSEPHVNGNLTGAGQPGLLLRNVLYPDCLIKNWQMNDSERMALTGLLARHQPKCSIEVGTYWGGSLSLIAQYSKFVFSVDVDETIPSRFSFKNVSFLTGRSTEIVPYLLAALDDAGIPVNFVLIDGDHSAEGVKNDVRCLLSYVPKIPMLVALHDSFNPECRRGMLEADWGESPYCHWVDIDFVPGRVVEHAGPSQGELWGGLALALFHPAIRTGAVQINCTAEKMFQLLQLRGAAARVG